MHNFNTIAAEIVELNAIKAAYIHYLASYDARLEVENTTLVNNNRRIISKSIKQLYELLEKQKAIRLTKDINMKFRTHKHSELEERAILHFNSDKRYTINE